MSATIKNTNITDFGLMQTPKSRKQRLYEKQREEDVLNNAINHGYLISPSLDDIILNSEDRQEERIDTSDKVLIVTFNLARVQRIDDIRLCLNLTICNLCCNFIKDIEQLKSCRNLVKLDLHGNRITELPDNPDFWLSLQQLRILYLHDNQISAFDNLNKLKMAQGLVMLTLYDTPLSLKRHYRHFTVNALWSLKALDNIVISDEEIIEDAKFGTKYSSMQPQFKYNCMSIENGKRKSYKEEWLAMHKDIATINQIQAKYCPVLIIQRYIRGFLVRLRYKYIQDTRIWAVVTIQRFYRYYKGYPPLVTSARTEGPNVHFNSHSSMKLDYESYMKSIHSKDQSVMTIASQRTHFPQLREENLDRKLSEISDHSFPRKKSMKQKLVINLNKLYATTSEIIDNAESSHLANGFENFRIGLKSSSIRPNLSSESKPESYSIDMNRLTEMTGMTFLPIDREAQSRDRKTLGKYFTQYKFLGAQSHSDYDQHVMNEIGEKEDENVYKIPFRLSVTVPPILSRDLLEELFIETIEGARDIRNSIRKAEMDLANLPPKVIKKKPVVTVDQRIFIRTHGTMGLGTFRAVEQAYKDRDRAEALSTKISQVRQLKKRCKQSIERTKNYKIKYSQMISSRRTEDKEIVSEAIAENKKQDKSLFEDLQSKRMASKQRKHQMMSDRRFALDFIAQNNAVSKALAVHARTIENEKKVRKKEDNVESWKLEGQQQKETIHRFQEHQHLMQQAETAMARANLEGSILLNRSTRRKEMKHRVEKLKEQKPDVDKKIVSITLAPSYLPPLAVIAPQQFETWENLPKKELIPRIHDRELSWI